MKKHLKKKGFVIDKICEDSFYENLLLGLNCLLRGSPFITDIKLERFPPATNDEVLFWETSNSLRFPPDLRSFYLSTDGFSFTYNFHYVKSDDLHNPIKAGIEINSLSKIEKVIVNGTTFFTDSGLKIVPPNSTVYTLTKWENGNCVVLAEFVPFYPASIWYYFKAKNFYFLCSNFETYFRMAIAHLGVPEWERAILKAELPEWSQEILQILAPGIFDRFVENKAPLNKLDYSIFENCNEEDYEITKPEEKEKSNSIVKQKKSAKNKPRK